MKILVIGSGAREHTIIWKLSQSNRVKKIYAAPGNAGIAQLAENVDLKVDEIEKLAQFAQDKAIDLTIVGPEAPLVAGIVDVFEARGLKTFGPAKNAAILEGSKVFAKEFMKKYQIPTAGYKACNDFDTAYNELKQFQFPIVIKADGLAAGKGVLICQNLTEAQDAITSIMKTKKFGEAGNQIIIEEYLTGTEASLLCFVSGNKIIPMESARDYKKALDNDAGLNTGGMGSFSPNTIFNSNRQHEIKTNILDNISTGLQQEGIDFRGVLFIGLMITKTGSKVLEFNVRFGDPEAEVVLPRLDSDLVTIIEKTIDGTIESDDLQWSKQKCVCVIAASGGYPQSYQKGKPISGFDTLDKEIIVFHGGTKAADNAIVTSGGRVFAVTALGNTLKQAREKVYDNIKRLHFDDMFYRRDIARVEENQE